MAKFHNLLDYSKMKKDELVTKTAQIIIEDLDTCIKFFNSDHVQAIEDIHKGNIDDLVDQNVISFLLKINIIHEYMSDDEKLLFIAEDVYENINALVKENEALIEMNSFILLLLYYAVKTYGVISIEDYSHLLHENILDEMSADEIKELLISNMDYTFVTEFDGNLIYYSYFKTFYDENYYSYLYEAIKTGDVENYKSITTELLMKC